MKGKSCLKETECKTKEISEDKNKNKIEKEENVPEKIQRNEEEYKLLVNLSVYGREYVDQTRVNYQVKDRKLIPLDGVKYRKRLQSKT